VVVVGSVNVDLVVTTDRLPGPGETVIGGRFQQGDGGKGGNQAAAAARLGARTWFIGCVGPDQFGADARRGLQSAGVQTELVATGSAPTGVAVVLVDATGENSVAVASGANAQLDAEWVGRCFERLDVDRLDVDGLDVERAVVLACLEIPDEAVTAAAIAAEARGWPFVLNPAPARQLTGELLRRTTVLTPNAHEVHELGFASVEDLLGAGVGAVAVTRGGAGVDLYAGRGQPPLRPVHVPAFAVEAVDTTGAGDAFSGALAWALARGDSVAAAVKAAAAAGALATRSVGARTGLPDRAQLDELMARTGTAG
jgi:ribokinase